MQAAANRGPQVGDLTQTLDIVKLISNEEDNKKFFFVNRDVACQSKMIKEEVKTAPKMGNTQTREINIDLPASTLETVVKYLHYRCINSRLAQADRTAFDIKPAEALDILKAAIYLQC